MALRVAVITPTRNRRDKLKRAIESVLAQTEPDFEHIVVDDASDDGTAAMVAEIRDPRLRYAAFDSWRGANAARNEGLRLTSAPIVTFLDSDDVFLPFRLEHVLAIFDAEPATDLVLSSFDMVKAGASAACVNPEGRLAPDDLERALVAQVLKIAGTGISMRRPLADAAGGFDESLMRLQDREFLLRLARSRGARLSARIDWIKHHDPHSISGRTEGYVEAYGALIGRRPDLVARYPDLVAYMIARRIAANLIQGRLRAVIGDLRENRRSPALGFSPAQLAAAYRAGRARRRAAASDLKRIGGPA